MAITHLSWNVQNFGQGTAAYNQAKGVNSAFLATFIARLAQRHGVSVIFIMEVTMTALPHLQSLLTSLNAVASGGANDWMFDYIRGSIAVPPGAPVNAPGDLSWRSGNVAPRYEGYAVFWRNGHPDFNMMRAPSGMSYGSWVGGGYAPPAPVPTHVLSLSRQGRRIAYPSNPIRAMANFNPAGAPWAAAFEDSYYPDVAKALGPGSAYYERTRRPATVSIRRTAGMGDASRIVPLMAYHAPSNAALAGLGTFVSGMAKELYVSGQRAANNRPTALPLIHPVRAVASGDFNLQPQIGANWTRGYGAYVNAFGAVAGANPAGGAGCTPAYTNLGPVATTIQIRAQAPGGLFNGPPINSANNANYEFSSLDNIFERGTAHTFFGIVDMMPEVRGANADIVAGIQAYAPHMNALHVANGGANANTGPVDAAGHAIFPFFSVANDWTNFRAGVNAGSFPTARSAAVFLHKFVSDHLPMMIRFT